VEEVLEVEDQEGAGQMKEEVVVEEGPHLLGAQVEEEPQRMERVGQMKED